MSACFGFYSPPQRRSRGTASFRRGTFPSLAKEGNNRLPESSSSRAEEGSADAVAAAGVVLVKRIYLLTNTTPSARAKVASQLFSLPRSHPSSAEEGN